MINVTTDPGIEKSLHHILLDRIPKINLELSCTEDKSCAFKIAAFFATYAKQQIKSGNEDEVARCFRVADEVVRLSSTESKHAIENIFLFALSKYIQADPKIFSLMPLHLKRTYQKSHSGRGK